MHVQKSLAYLQPSSQWTAALKILPLHNPPASPRPEALHGDFPKRGVTTILGVPFHRNLYFVVYSGIPQFGEITTNTDQPTADSGKAA